MNSLWHFNSRIIVVVVQNPDRKINKNWEPGERRSVRESRTKGVRQVRRNDDDLGKMSRSCRQAQYIFGKIRTQDLGGWDKHFIPKRVKTTWKEVWSKQAESYWSLHYCNFSTCVFSYYSKALLLNLTLVPRLRRRSGCTCSGFLPYNFSY
jgi:hypothetical protein